MYQYIPTKSERFYFITVHVNKISLLYKMRLELYLKWFIKIKSLN